MSKEQGRTPPLVRSNDTHRPVNPNPTSRSGSTESGATARRPGSVPANTTPGARGSAHTRRKLGCAARWTGTAGANLAPQADLDRPDWVQRRGAVGRILQA
ncbi:hypothetical protein T484DRAFT_1959573 [Baffinella frigidus]|nr:hypothetical protein T484DRAFT_1959573 [Cryptophyta sp. CCMP2293]